MGGVDIQKDEIDTMVEQRFNECLFNKCLTLENGKLAYCSRATNAYRVQGFDYDAKDFLLVEKSLDFRKKLENYIIHPHYMKACIYCNGTSLKHRVKPAVQI